MSLMRLLAPAKINLFLRVGPRRDDGFHPLLSWMTTVGLFDNLEFERIPSPGIHLTAQGNPDAPADRSNLVVRAAEALAHAAHAAGGPTAPLTAGNGLGVHLTKRIPIGAGLGGGSSDAARTLLGLNRLWGLNWPVSRLHDLAASLGSDVPFLLHTHSALCAGRGDRLAPLAAPAVAYAVLLFPPYGLSTPAVYRRFDELAERPGADRALAPAEMGVGEMSQTGEPLEARAFHSSSPLPSPAAGAGPAESPESPASPWSLAPAAVEPWVSWTTLPSAALLPRLVNDLEAPAFSIRPELGQLRSALEQSLSRIVRMSGSGSTLFTLADSETEAHRLAARASSLHDLPAQAVRLCPALQDDLG